MPNIRSLSIRRQATYSRTHGAQTGHQNAIAFHYADDAAFGCSHSVCCSVCLSLSRSRIPCMLRLGCYAAAPFIKAQRVREMKAFRMFMSDRLEDFVPEMLPNTLRCSSIQFGY